MTRIGNSYGTQASLALSGRAMIRRDTGSRVVPVVEADVVSDQPVEEVVFEAKTGIKDRDRRRNLAVQDVTEEVLVERRQNAQGQKDFARGPFWQRYSTPFMAQMIGQSAAPVRDASQTYGAAQQALPRTRHSKAV